MGPDCTARANGGDAHRYPPHRDVRGGSSSSPRCLSPHCTPFQKKQCAQSSPESQQQQHQLRALSSPSQGSPLMYTVCPNTPDGSMNPCHRASPPYRSHASTHSRLGDSASHSSAMTETGMCESNSDLPVACPTWFNRCAASWASLSSVMASRDLPPLQAHSPDLQNRRQQQLNSITAVVSYSSPLSTASESAHMKTVLTSFDETSGGGLTSPNSYCGGVMTSNPQQQSRVNCCGNVGNVMPPEVASHPGKLSQSGMLNSPLLFHPGDVHTARVRGTSPYPRALDGPASQQQEAHPQATPQLYPPGSGVNSAGASVSAVAGGVSLASTPTSEIDANTIVTRRHKNNSPALNSSLEERIPPTAAPVFHRHTPSSSVHWPHDTFVLSPLSRGETPFSRLHSRAALLPAHESTPVVPPTTSPENTSTPLRASESAPRGIAADYAGGAPCPRSSPPRPHAFAQHQSPENGFIDLQPARNSNQRTQLLHPPAPTFASPKAPKLPVMFGVIDLSYSRTEASGSKTAAPTSVGATTIGASAAVKTRTHVRTSSRVPAVISARSSVSSLSSNDSTPVTSVINHADPMASTVSESSTAAEAASAAQLNGKSTNREVTARSGTTMLRVAHSAGQTDSRHSKLHATFSHNPDTTTTTTTTTTEAMTLGCPSPANSRTPVHTTTVASHHGTLFTPLSPLLAEDDDDAIEADQQQRNAVPPQQHMNSVAPTTLSRSTNSTTITAHKSGTAGVAASNAGRLARGRTVLHASSTRAHNMASRESGPRENLASTFTGSSSFSSNATAVMSSVSASSTDTSVLASPRGGHGRRQSSVGTASTSSVTSDMLRASPRLTGYSFAPSRAQMQRYIDQWRDRFEEDKNSYKEGGYLTVTPGRIVHSRYVLIQKLGWGEFSTVWLGYDTKHATLGRGLSQAFVAVKVAKCRTSIQEATRYEVSLLRYLEARLPRHAAITNIIDCFDVRGEFGMHTCMVLPLCGPNLLSIIERMKVNRSRRSAEDLRMIKEIVLSVLISLHELSELNVVHTDIKPENVLCSAVDSKLVSSMERFCSYNQERSHMISAEDFRKSMAQQSTDHLVYLADFGLSALLEPPGSAQIWTSVCSRADASLLTPLMRCKKNFPVTRPGVMDNLRGTLIQTREYRAPEVLLGLDFTCATDVWSVGCMTFELITGSFLMDPKRKTREPRDMDIEHLAMMMQILGPLPPEITNIRVRNNDYYDAILKGTPAPKSESRPPPEYLHRFVDRNGKFIYASRYHSYRHRNLEAELEPFLGSREAHLTAAFIVSCLHSYDPRKRPSAKKLLSHQWFHGVGGTSKEKASPR